MLPLPHRTLSTFIAYQRYFLSLFPLGGAHTLLHASRALALHFGRLRYDASFFYVRLSNISSHILLLSAWLKFDLAAGMSEEGRRPLVRGWGYRCGLEHYVDSILAT